MEPVPGSALSLRHGCRCVPDEGVTVEDLLVVIGEQLGFENIVSASRMYKAIVVFLKSEALVNQLTVSGVWVKESFVPVTPLSAPATKITVSNVPPFISNDAIIKELGRFGKIASPMKFIPLGCKNASLKHVLSFRRQVFMFLTSPTRTLDVSFRVGHSDRSYLVYASNESLKCFICGDVGHKKFVCPRKNEQQPSTTQGEGITVDLQQNNGESEQKQAEGTDEVNVQEQEVSDFNHSTAGPGSNVEPVENATNDDNNAGGSSNVEPVENVIDNDNKIGGGSNEESVLNITDGKMAEGMDEIGGLEENLTDESEAMSQMTDEGEQWSDIQRDDAQDLYTVDEINAFLDETKGKSGVEIKDYFPDVEKFILSVTHIRKKSNEELTQQKRFRLKKHLTNIRKKRYQLRKTTEGKN
ncbi:Transposon TX1 uncharacterized 82 kDa protein [Labeo rohita]|uniref:Transposon TX1 uncharacterized 82 kDa protein n=2 Tax=Labeonini TaxID=2743697 RepID=A0ABQ8LAN9_LABRO|nr:Transposon TX1 uncharacterized 82 kDa protein [Labeo rohita]